MTSIRLVADDLTGALDTAAELVGLADSPVHAFWNGAIPPTLPPNAALDSGTRELDAASGAAIAAALAPTLAGADIAYKKLDSLLRGPTLAEAAALFRTGRWQRAVLAPAFPYQGRVTRGGVQHARDHAGFWSPVGGDVVGRLLAEGVPARHGQPGAPLLPGITVFDAETDEDLRRVVACAQGLPGESHGVPPGAVLWMGAGGLAQALAYGSRADAGAELPLPLPLLGLFGSDQAVTAGQLAACGADWKRLRDGGPAEAEAIAARLRGRGRVVASLDLPSGLQRDDAAARIGTELRRLVHRLPPPGTLLAAGGETLRGLCVSLGARSLEVRGRIVPGVPVSIMRGGRWDGVTVVSKSGAFGHPTLLRDLLLRSGAHTATERTA